MPTHGGWKDRRPGPSLYSENELRWWVIRDLKQNENTTTKMALSVTLRPADEKISVSYSEGDDACGNGVNATTVIQLSCGSTVGHPKLVR